MKPTKSSTAPTRAKKYGSDALGLIRIGLVMPMDLAFYRDILRGVREQASMHPTWTLFTIAPDRNAIERSQELGCAGYIAHVFRPAVAEALHRINRPVVNVAGNRLKIRFPHVHVDHETVGQIAAKHFIDRGLKHFGFVGYDDFDFSLGREKGFRNTLRAAGYSVEHYYDRQKRLLDPTGYWSSDSRLMRWLEQAPKPFGVLASHDPQAVQIAEFCLQLRIRVPEQVAIIGVDDDDLLCELARPSLSSVALPGMRIGNEAAKMLNAWLETGRMPKPSNIVLPPRDIVIRQSSDLAALDDPDVRAALQFVRSNAHRELRAAEVVDHTSLAQRSLERRFQQHLGRGIAAEIRRAHLERAQQLLRDTAMPIQLVATRSGFSDNRQLSLTFRKLLATTPSQYRASAGGRSTY